MDTPKALYRFDSRDDLNYFMEQVDVINGFLEYMEGYPHFKKVLTTPTGEKQVFLAKPSIESASEQICLHLFLGFFPVDKEELPLTAFGES